MRLFRPRASEDSQSEAESPSVAGERGIASVNRAASLSSRVSSVLAIGLMSALSLSLLTWYYARTFAHRNAARDHAQSATQARAQGDMALPPLGRIEGPHLLGPPPAPPAIETPTADPAVFAAAAPAGNTPGAPGTPAAKTPQELALERQLSGPAFIAGGNERGAAGEQEGAGTADTPQATDLVPDAAHNASPAGEGALTTLLRPSVTPAATAQVLPTQRFLLPKGAFIDCTLETAIDSTLPGMTTCITATDTFSADGTVVLLERGTKLVGETRGEVAQGSSRVFVLWTEARTPTGVVVPLASPGTDELGRSGLSGEVNRHFWQRFGAAILISVIGGAVQAGVQSTSSNGTVIIDPSSSQNVLTEVLKGTVNIPPTITKQNGDRIQVFVARDLDFRSVYELHAVAH